METWTLYHEHRATGRRVRFGHDPGGPRHDMEARAANLNDGRGLREERDWKTVAAPVQP